MERAMSAGSKGVHQVNLEDMKGVAAMWGALTGTVSLCWTIYAEITKRRPKLRVAVSKDIWMEYPHIPGDEPREYVDFEFANNGLTDVTLRGYAFCHFGNPGWILRMDLKGSFPRKLEPGDCQQVRVSLGEFLWYGVDPGSIILLAFDTMGRTYLAKGRRLHLVLWKIRWALAHARESWNRRAKRRKVKQRVKVAGQQRKAGRTPGR